MGLNINFRTLLMGQLVSQVGTSIYLLALSFWLLDKTDSTVKVSVVLSAALIPRLIFTPVIGPLIDRLNKKYILVISDIVAGLAITTLALVSFYDFYNYYFILFITLVVSICSDFFRPTVFSIMPELIAKESLQKANTQLTTTTQLSKVLGESLGGFLYGILSAPFVFALNGLSYILSAVSESFIKYSSNVKTGDIKFKNILGDNKEALSFLLKDNKLVSLFIVLILINFFGNLSLFAMIPFFADDSSLGAKTYGVSMACYSAGIILGMNLVNAKKLQKLNPAIIFDGCIIFLCFFFMLFSSMELDYLFWGCIFLAGLFNGPPIVYISTLIQTSTPKELMGKVFSLRSLLSHGLVPLAIAMGGYLTSVYSPGAVITYSFLIILIGYIIIRFLTSFSSLFEELQPKDSL